MEENRFGKRLRELRLEKEMTGEDLGKLLGKSRSVIGHWENAIRQPSIEEILWLSNFFSCTELLMYRKIVQPSTRGKQKV